jgi:hypothetical protein
MDIKNKLYANLFHAEQIVLDEGPKIIKRYRDVDFYLKEIGFGNKKNFKGKK